MKYVITIGIFAVIISGMFLFSDSYPLTKNDLINTTETNLTKLPDHKVSEVRPTEIVELEDGDSYDMEATIVTQEVGNRTVKRLAYNGQIPGPVLKVQKGSKVTINFTNNIDMETALHSHGLRGDWRFDGATPITPPVEVGESFSYELEFPDTGVFWYHPHVREDYQQELGLYGNMIVEEDGYWNEVAQEEYLILDDYLKDGEFERGVITNTLMGRFGDTLLINDREDFEVEVTQGEITRIFLTNVANTRTFDVEFGGTEIKLVGGDIGRIENEVIVDNITIAPAERYIIEVLYKETGNYSIIHRGEQIGTVVVKAGNRDESANFTQLRDNSADYESLRNQQTSLLAQAPDKNLRLDIEMKGMVGSKNGMMGEGMMMHVDDDDPAHIEEDEMMTEHCGMMPEMAGCPEFTADHGEEYMMDETEAMEHGEDSIEWEDNMAMMNNMSNDKMMRWVIEDTDTGNKNEEIDWTFNEGDLVKIRVFNDDKGLHPMQHPLHFHGQRFVVLSADGEVNENMQWKDTTLIPSGVTIDLLVDMSNAGKWMAHCHIAEHLHSGMMFNFNVK